MPAHVASALPAANRTGPDLGSPLAASQPTEPASGSPHLAEERRRLAPRVLADALLLGIVGDALLRVSSSGANLTIWSIGMVVALATLARRRHDALPTDARWLALPAVALALMFLWRDSASLAAYNVLALVGTFALLAAAVAQGSGATLAGIRVRDLARIVASAGVSTLFGMLPLVLTDVSFRDAARTRGATAAVAAVRSALIAIPLLLVFGGLFASADPVFARVIGDAFRVDAGEIASHLILSGVVAWMVGGYLRGALLSPVRVALGFRFPDGALGLAEVSVALGSLIVLFVTFVAIQLRYFFGGDGLVQATAGMSYADYARRGFFELVTVAALVLPVLLAAGALLRREGPRAERVYRLLAGTVVALLAPIMYSALARMQLYQAAYGLSTDRVYATAFMAWLAGVFAWFCVTMLRGRPRLFCGGLLVSAWGMMAALNALGPAGYVARANIARAERGQRFDVRYAASLGGDAVPPLVSYLVREPASPAVPAGVTASGVAAAPDSASESSDDSTARCYAARTLLDNWAPASKSDWRSWNVGRAAARRAAAANEGALRRLASLAPAGSRNAPCPLSAAALQRAAAAAAAGVGAATAVVRP